MKIATNLNISHPEIAVRFVRSNTPNKTPENVSAGSDAVFVWTADCGHEWDRRVSHEVSNTKDKPSCRVCNNKLLLKGFNDFATLYPEHAKDWDYEKNDKFPEDFIGAGKTVVNWKCESGHEWESSLGAKIRLQNCGECFKTRNDWNVYISTVPELVKEWDFEANGENTPDKVMTSNKKPFHWVCENNHKWTTAPSTRLGRKKDLKTFSLCPVCSNRKLIKGINDLLTAHPEVEALWDYEKNTINPSEVGKNSNKPYYTKCSNNHEWSFRPQQYTDREIKCPACNNLPTKTIFTGTNDLTTTHPELASEWHPTKNGTLTPDSINSNSGEKVWWLGKDCNHEWKATIQNRKIGKACAVCAGRQIQLGINDLPTTDPETTKSWHPTKNGDKKPEQYTYGSDVKVWWQCQENPNHTWKSKIVGRRRSGCPICAKLSSKDEQAIYQYIVSLGFTEAQANVRGVCSPRQELDIYIPEKNFAIEYNGLYWHSEESGKDINYHYDKWKSCADKGIQLVQVWEDSWKSNPEQVKQMLAHKLGVSGERKVFARKTKVKIFEFNDVKPFLDKNHIQGATSGSVYAGLVDSDGVLVAVLVCKWEQGNTVLNIVRYATAVNVVGGFTKLLTYVERNYNPKKFVTFSDNTVSDGALYEGNGFVADKMLPPDYMYVVDGVREHKFGYRLKRFINDDNLVYEQGLTEKELAALNGLQRVWDAGKTRWVKVVSR